MRYTMALGLLAALTAGARADYGRLRVVLPSDAVLMVNGVQSRNQTSERLIESQDLEPGKEYFYSLEATATRNGIPYTERRTVSVEAGYETKVTFSFPQQVATYNPSYNPYQGNYPPSGLMGGGGSALPGNPANPFVRPPGALGGGGNAIVGTPNPFARPPQGALGGGGNAVVGQPNPFARPPQGLIGGGGNVTPRPANPPGRPPQRPNG